MYSFIVPIIVKGSHADSTNESDPGTPPDGMIVYGIGNESWKDADCQFGTVLMGGGTEQVSAMRWMTNRTDYGDFVVIRTDDSEEYQDFIYNEVGYVDSCHTLVINTTDYANSDYTEQVILNAEAIWIAGGNQTEYYDLWNGTKVENALESAIENRSALIGGTSAGMAVLGDIDYIPQNLGVRSSEALMDPYHDYMKKRKEDFFNGIPYLDKVITDTHLSERDRIGRTITFLARNIEDNKTNVTEARVITCDESTTVCIDENGSAEIYGWDGYTDYAFFIRAETKPDRCISKEPLYWKDAVEVYKVKGKPYGNNTFDLKDWNGTGGKWEDIDVINGTLDNYIQEPDTDSSLNADTGENKTVGINDDVIFDGSNSTDDGYINNYTWIIDGIEYYGKKIKHSFDELGKKEVFLKVIDSDGYYETDSAVVSIVDDVSPVAEAGNSKTISYGEACYFNAENSTDNVGIVNYTWNIQEKEFYVEQMNYTFTDIGHYKSVLTVEDEAGNKDSDSIVVTVEDETDPIADARENLVVGAGEKFSLNAGESKDNHEITNYTWYVKENSFYGEQMNHSFTEVDTYNVSLIVEDASGNTDSDSVNVTVEDKTDPIADAGLNRTVDEDEKVTFNASGSFDNLGLTNYTWMINGEIKIGKEVTYEFTEPGRYKVELNVTDSMGNYDADMIFITVQDVTKPVASISGETNVDEDVTVDLSASNTSDNVGVVNYTWIVDGSEIYGEMINHTFVNPGTYTIKLNVTDNAGNYDAMSMEITVEDTTDPKACAGVDKTVSINEKVTLDADNSTDNKRIESYIWLIEGEEYRNEIIHHKFSVVGEHKIELTVADAAGNLDNDSVIITIVDSTAPEVRAGENLTSGVDEEITLDASHSTDNGNIKSYKWTIDGKDYYGIRRNYSFDEVGTHDVILTVTDTAGNIDTEKITVTVKDTIDPSSSIEIEGELIAGSEIILEASSSSDNVGIASYEWKFGDRTTAYGETVDHTYDTSDNYTVTLIVTDENGNQDIYTTEVKVKKDEGEEENPVTFLLIMIVSVPIFILFYYRKTIVDLL